MPWGSWAGSTYDILNVTIKGACWTLLFPPACRCAGPWYFRQLADVLCPDPKPVMSIFDKRGLKQNSLSASCQQLGEWKGTLPIGKPCVLDIRYMTLPIIWGAVCVHEQSFQDLCQGGIILLNLHRVVLSRCEALILLPSGALGFLELIDNDVCDLKLSFPFTTEWRRGVQMTRRRSRDPFTSSHVWLWFGIEFTVILFRRTWSVLWGVNQYLSETFYGTLDYCWKCQAWHARRALDFISVVCGDGK